MAASASITVDPETIQIQSGGSAAARVTVLNRGDTVGQYVVDVQGVDPGWIKLESQQLGIFPGDQAKVQLSIRPSSISVSATFKVLIRVVNQVDPADTAQVALTLSVQRADQSADKTVLVGRPAPANPSAVPLASPPLAQASDLQQKPLPKSQPAGQTPLIIKEAVQVSSPSGQMKLAADKDGLQVLPGTNQVINLGISNNGGVSLDLELQVKGPPISWLGLTPGAALTLAPGESTVTALSVSIPAQAPLGDYPLTIILHGVDDTTLKVRLNMMIGVIKPGDIIITLQPAQQETELSAEYRVQLSQSGAAPVVVNLTGRDDAGRMEYSFSPATLAIPAGGQVISKLIVRARQNLTDVESRPFSFQINAMPADGSAGSVSAQGSLIQRRAASGSMVLQPEEQRDAMRGVFTVLLSNPSLSAATFRLSAGDADGGCAYQFESPMVNVPPGGRASTRLYVTPTQYLDRGEVSHTFQVTAQSSNDSSSALRLGGRYIQAAVQSPRIVLSPSSQTSAGPASFSVVVSNPRPTALQVELRPSDPTNRVEFRIEPSGLAVPPQSQAAARLDVFPVSPLLSGENRRVCTFSVAGYPVDMPNPVAAEGELLLVNGLTWRKLLPYLLAIILIMGMGGTALLVWVYLTYYK